MKKNNLKILFLILLFNIFIFINIKNYVYAISNKLENNIFRLHIVANSNSQKDQELKLKIRDEIIKYIETIENNSKSQVISNISNNLNVIKNIAQKTILENGFNYDVTVEIGKFYFPTKYYGNISLPAGDYDAIQIKIGNANGENWWCSLFPPLCFTDISSGIINEQSEKDLKNNLNNEEFLLITSSSPKYKFKFKLIELLNHKKIL